MLATQPGIPLAKRELDEFIDFVLSQDSRQAMTLEAYAEALANVIRLFSAHLTAVEAAVTSRSETFTMMDFFNQTSHWFTLLGKLASFHRQVWLATISNDILLALYNQQEANKESFAFPDNIKIKWKLH